MGKELDIQSTVKRARAGYKEAFGMIYDAYLDAIYRFVYFRVGSRPEAEDITEQIFVSIFESIGRYHDRGMPFEAWIYRIARNKVIDYYRTRKPKIPISEIINVPDDNPTPEELTEQQLTRDIVMQSLTKLPHAYQEILILKFIEEKENEEISIILEKPIDQIRVLQSRAILKLRKIMKYA